MISLYFDSKICFLSSLEDDLDISRNNLLYISLGRDCFLPPYIPDPLGNDGSQLSFIGKSTFLIQSIVAHSHNKIKIMKILKRNTYQDYSLRIFEHLMVGSGGMASAQPSRAKPYSHRMVNVEKAVDNARHPDGDYHQGEYPLIMIYFAFI